MWPCPEGGKPRQGFRLQGCQSCSLRLPSSECSIIEQALTEFFLWIFSLWRTHQFRSFNQYSKLYVEREKCSSIVHAFVYTLREKNVLPSSMHLLRNAISRFQGSAFPLPNEYIKASKREYRHSYIPAPRKRFCALAPSGTSSQTGYRSCRKQWCHLNSRTWRFDLFEATEMV